MVILCENSINEVEESQKKKKKKKKEITKKNKAKQLNPQ